MSLSDKRRAEFRLEYDKVLSRIVDLGRFALVRQKDLRKGYSNIKLSQPHIQRMTDDMALAISELESVGFLLEEWAWEHLREKNFEEGKTK
jgi:hypothetical protein